MAPLRRPSTLKEFVIQSLGRWREPAATIVDHDDELPTVMVHRPGYALMAPRPLRTAVPPARDFQESLVDLPAPAETDEEVPTLARPSPLGWFAVVLAVILLSSLSLMGMVAGGRILDGTSHVAH